MKDIHPDKARTYTTIMGILFLSIALLFVVHFCAAQENARIPSPAFNGETPSAEMRNAPQIPDLQSYEGFLSIGLRSAAPSLINSDLNLYLDGGGNCFFFLPAFASIDDFHICFDDALYDIEIDGSPVSAYDSLASCRVGERYPVTIRTGAEDAASLTLTFLQSQNLPAVFISTATGSLDYMHASKEHREPGDFVCILPDGSTDSSGELSAIKCHGNASYIEAVKKSYQIIFDADTDVLSMGNASGYILQANAFDAAYMRNEIVYSYCREVGIPYAVDTEYVDLYFNGEYAGNYLLCEKVETGIHRIDISEDGYLIEKIMRSRIEEGDYAFSVDDMGWFIVKQPELLSDEALSFVSEYMNSVKTLIENCDSAEKFAKLSEQIDVGSFADMYLVNAITNDVDSNIASTYYYLSDSGEGYKLYAGPVWDYDNAFGRHERGYDTALSAYPSGYCEELYEIPYFRDIVAEKFNTVYAPLMETYLSDNIPQCRSYIHASVLMETCRWNAEGYHSSAHLGYDDAVSYLYDYIRSRLDHVRDRIDHPELYHHIRFINTAGRGEYRDSELWLKDGSRISDPIMEQMADRFYSDGFHFQNGTPFSNTRPVFSDMTLYSDE